jgi:hypothetical protein
LARQYAGIMASLGMTVVIVRSLRSGGAFEAAIVSAMTWMVTLGVIGYVIAAIAQNTVDESVRQRMEDEINNALNPVAPRSAEASA